MMIRTELNNTEMTCTMEALYDFIKWRMLGCIRPSHFRRVEWEGMHLLVKSGWSAYWKVRVDMQETTTNEFMEVFGFSELAIQLADDLLLADTWEEVPDHSEHEIEDCELCKELSE